VTTCVGVAYLIVVFFGGFILKYLKSSTIYLIAAFITSISLFIFATNQEILSISIASVFSGIGLGTLSLVNYKTIGGLKGESGKISGIITFTTGVTLCMAPMTISCITEMSSFKAGFLTLITPFALLIILVIFRGKIRNGALSIIGLKEKKNVLNS